MSEEHVGVPVLERAPDGADGPLDALFFVIIALFLGVFTKHMLAWTRIPFTALLLVWGVLLGIGSETYTKNWRFVGPGIAFWEDIEPNFFLALLLPLILYAAAISLHWHTLRRCLIQVIVLAGPGVIVGATLTAIFVRYAFPYNWSWLESLLFGSILSATDPVAVIALLQEVGAEKELRTVIEGESLFNDGSAYVLFLLFRNALEGDALTGRSVVSQLSQLALGGPAVGMAFGICMVAWLRYIYNQDVVEVTLTIVAAMGSFIVANEILGVSGVLAVLILGIWMAAFGTHHISRSVQRPLHIVWEELEFIANTLIFILAGVIIAGNVYLSQHSPSSPVTIRGRDYGYAFLLWVALLAIRVVVFAVCYPFLKYTGYGITMRKAAVCVWAGLRGAVGLALSMFLLFDGKVSDRSFRLLAFFFTGMIAAITILVQGATTGLLLEVLGLTRRLSAKRAFLNNVMHQVEQHGEAHAKMVKHSNVLGAPNWRDISSLASLNAKQLLTRYDSVVNMKRPFPYWDPSADVELEASQRTITAQHQTSQVRQETRARLLRAVQQTYEDVFERAQIVPGHMYQLQKSANQALDHTDKPLCDWKYLQQNLHLPRWLRVLFRLHRLPFVANISRKRLFEHLQDCASVMIAFHYAHTDAAHSMLHFDLIVEQDQHLAAHVQNESQHQLDNAQSSTSEIQLNGNAAQSASHDFAANGAVPPNGNSHADGSQAEADSSAKAGGLSSKGGVSFKDPSSGGPSSPGLPRGRSRKKARQEAKRANAAVVLSGDSADAAKADIIQGIIQQIIEESRDQLRLVEQQLKALRTAYPEVMASIRTRQVAQEMLLAKEAHIHELRSSGLMDEAEVEEVAHLIERQKKRLHFAGSLLRVQPAAVELRQLTAFHGLSDQELAKVMAAAKVMVLPPGSPLHPASDNHQQLLVILRGAVHMTASNPPRSHQASSQQQPDATSSPLSNGKQPQLDDQSDAAGPMLSHDLTNAESDHMHSGAGQGDGGAAGHSHAGPFQAGHSPARGVGGSQMQEKGILDARGCAFALPGLLLGKALDVHVTAKTVVEAYSIPWSLIQGLAERNQSQSALKVRLLQSCGAHMAMCHGGSCFRAPSWRDIISVFRKGRLQIVAEGSRVRLNSRGLIFLMSGQLQMIPGTVSVDGDSMQGSPSSSSLHADAESPRHSSARSVWSGPASFIAKDNEAVCLQAAQIFHLPEAMLQQAQAQQSLTDASEVEDDNDDGYQAAADVSEQGGFGGASATDTGRWGKRMHEPSPFLSHDLWGKLGKA